MKISGKARRIVLLTGLGALLAGHASAQSDSSGIHKKRLRTVGITTGVLYTGGIIGFNELWYKNQPRTSFHFFNDNNQWQQVDKVGHTFGSFYESRAGVDILKWCGVPERKAIWYGSMTGFVMQLPIEVLDGFAADFGASTGDLIANAAGSGLVLGQHLLWDELRIQMKYSFHRTGFSNKRPEVLGANYGQELFKDYNGQTYWLSADLHAFMPEGNNFPRWLNVAAGYGASEMVYGKPGGNRRHGYRGFRKFYLAPDIDLLYFKTDSKFLNTILYIVNGIHWPLPALEWSQRSGMKFHGLYF